MFIDLRVEQKPGSDSITLAGQVVDAQLADGVLGEIPVLLFSKGDTELETTTNRFGEFNLSFKAIGPLGLLLSMKISLCCCCFPKVWSGVYELTKSRQDCAGFIVRAVSFATSEGDNREIHLASYSPVYRINSCSYVKGATAGTYRARHAWA